MLEEIEKSAYMADMAIDVALLTKICEAAGPSGYERAIRKIVLEELEGLADEITTDQMGNVIALKRGKSSKKRVMAAAHMDEIGFIVTQVDEKGFLHFNPIGGFDPKTLTAQRVIVHGREDVIGVMGAKPIHVMSAEERKKTPEINDYFIDLGLPKRKVERLVSVGDFVTRYSPLIEIGDCVNVKSLDNRVSVFILLESLRGLKKRRRKPSFDFYAAFTVQEEVGLRGAQVAAHAVKPDFSFGLDTTIAWDAAGISKRDQCTSLGAGTAIKLMDSSVICDYRMVAFMKEVAARNKIDWQSEILAAGGTDTANLQRMVPGGSIAGAVSVPTRHIHQSIEMCHKGDIEASIALLSACLVEIDQGNWEL